MKSRVGFIGLGVMGLPMAGHLARAGCVMTVFDIDHERVAMLCERYPEVRSANTPKEVAAHSDVVVTMLPDGKHVQEVAIGTDGLQEGFSAGGLLIDTSSSEPWLTIETAQKLATHGVQMLDAATSGAEMGAKAAQLVFMMGGTPEVIERGQEVLSVLGKQMFHLGPTGSGHKMKSINNMITAMTLVATAEGLVLGKKLGLDPNAMTDVLNASTGMSWISQTHIKQRITNRAFDDAFRLSLMLKDVRIGLGLAEESKIPLPLSELGASIYEQADAVAGDGASLSEVVRWVEKATSTRIEP